MQTLRRIPFWGAMALLIYMPFHVFLAQSLSLITGGLDAWKVGKDLITLLLMMFTICLVWAQKNRGVKDFNLFFLMSVAYGVLHVILWALHPDICRNCALLGNIYNYRLLAFLIIGMGAALVQRPRFTDFNQIIKIVIAVSSVVAAFGVVQYFLPADFMTHFGYSVERGVLPSFLIDNREGFTRVMSTLRDPNSFGAYLIVPITLLVGLIMRPGAKRWILGALLATHVTALGLTFSRGAWLSVPLSVGIFMVWRYSAAIKKFNKRWWPILAVVFVIGSASVVLLARNTYVFKSVITHRTGAPQGADYDSNGFHWVFVKRGLDGIVRSPFGHGPGTAGLASIQNPRGSFLTENYYVQIGYEVGVLGLLLFVAINVLVYLRLRRAHGELLPSVLMASFWGYVLMNMLFHTWSNEAVAAQWWILSGLVIGWLAAAKKSA